MLKRVQHDGAGAGWRCRCGQCNVGLRAAVILDLIQDLLYSRVPFCAGMLKQVQHDARGRRVWAGLREPGRCKQVLLGSTA